MDNLNKLARQWAQGVKSNPMVWNTDRAHAAAEFILAHTEPETPTMADVKWTTEYIFAGASDNHGTEVVMLDMWREEDGEPELYVTDPVDGGVVMEYPGHYTRNGKRYELVEVTDKPENPVEPSTKTMDEYSPVERADMVGMWAGYNRHKAGGEPEDFLIITGGETEAGRVPCYNPGAPTPHAWEPDKWMLTPRFDMPRAWGKDGEPCEPTVSFGENVGVGQPDHPATLSTLEDYENAPEGTVVAATAGLPFVKDEYGDWSPDVAHYANDTMSRMERNVLRWGWGEGDD